MGGRLRHARWAAACVSLALLLPAGVASADVANGDRALAAALFQEARALMAEGRFAAACEKFAESQRLDPGGGTLLNLARCHEQEGKTGTAWVEYHDAIALARRDGRADRESFAREHAASLEPRLARIGVDVSAASDVNGIEVLQDGVRVPRVAWGVAVPVDPGEHVVAVSAPSHRSLRITVEAKAGEMHLVHVPPLAAEAAPLAAAPLPVDAATPPPAVDPRQTGSRTMTTGGVVLAAAGAVSIAIGGYFGIRAISQHAKSEARCAATLCSPEGAAYEDSARSASNTATLTMAVGAVALAAGVGLVVFAPRNGSTRAALVPFGAGGALSGEF